MILHFSLYHIVFELYNKNWVGLYDIKKIYPKQGNLTTKLCDLQSAKIFLIPPKYEIIMVPSNHSNVQYCYRNIGLFSIAPCKVITLNPLCIPFGISSLLLFWGLPFYSYHSSNNRDSDSCRAFSILKAIAIRLPLLFANAFKSVKERQLLLSQ